MREGRRHLPPGKKKQGPVAKTSRGTEGLGESGSNSAFRGQNFFLKKGERKPVQFVTDPSEFLVFSNHSFRAEGQWWYVPCIEGVCPLCKEDDEDVKKVAKRFACLVYSHRDRKIQIFEGPKTLGLLIKDQYDRKPESFLKRVFDVAKFATQPITYQVDTAIDATPKNVKSKLAEAPDLNEWLQEKIDKYYGTDSDIEAEDTLDDPDEIEEEKPAAKKKPGRPAKKAVEEVDEDEELEDEDGVEENWDDDEDEEEVAAKPKPKPKAGKKKPPPVVEDDDEDEDEDLDVLDEIDIDFDEDEDEEEAEEPTSNVRKLPGRKAPAKAKPGKRSAR